MAGGVAQRSAKLSGSAAAIAAGSRVPNRSLILAGPANARSIGNCWSSIIPASRANGSSLRIWSAAGSWVICSCTALPGLSGGALLGLDRQHRALGVEEDPLRVAAEDEL